METSNQSIICQLWSLIVGDMEEFLVWFTSDEVQTQPKLVIRMLLYAACVGCTDVCLTIIDSGIVSDRYIESAFRTACESGKLETAQHIVQCGRINERQMQAALLTACSSCWPNKAVMNWLMDAVKVTQQERDSWMLIAAVARGDTLHDIQLLVGKVGKHAVKNMSRALLTACMKNRVDVVDWLTTCTAADASIKMKCEKEVAIATTMTSLAEACNKGNIYITRQLLHCVTPRTINTPCGVRNDSALHLVIWQAADCQNNPLHAACAFNSLYLDTNPLYAQDVNIQYKDGHTLLHLSSMVSYKEGVEMLLSVFADKEITNDDQQTPADSAKSFKYYDIVKLFSTSSV
jgi:hypothetical protein